MAFEKLRKRWEFERVYSEGRKFVNDIFVIYIAPNDLGINRLGIAVSKKLGKAVKRNRVRRLIRESFRLLEGRLREGFDIVVVGRSPAVGMKCQQIQAAMWELFRKAGISIDEGDRG